MSRKKKEKELKRRYGKMAESMEPYYHQLDLRQLEELDDDAFAFIMGKVAGVNMLDLNETDITNESIALLARLEYVHELRVKGCHRLDNGCIESLNRLKQLRFLHLKYTAVTMEGLLRLQQLPALKELHFSAEDDDNLEPAMRQLAQQLPGCTFVINGKPWFNAARGPSW